MPAWVTQAYEDYTRRLRSSMRIDLEELPVGKNKADEEKRLLERVGDDYLVALDEHGKSLTTLELAKWLGQRQQDGRNLSFVIGGPDGLGPGNPEESQPALVAVGADLPARHGSRDIGGTAVSRPFGTAESPVSSRVTRSESEGSMASPNNKNRNRCSGSPPPRRGAASC